LADALGSVRQWADAGGQVSYAAGYTPFGVEMWRGGSTASAWGYTGEWWDGDAGLLYLRARWYEPGVGRFTSRDPYQGSIRFPTSLHCYIYAKNNSVLLADPSGLVSLSPSLFPPQLGPTIGEMIDFFEWLYRKDGLISCSSIPDCLSPWDTAWDLFVDFVCEYGPEHRHFDADDYLTYELAASILVYNVRQQFYREGGQHLSGEMRFNVGEFLLASWDLYLLAPFKGTVGLLLGQEPINITHFLGTWDKYEVTLSGSDRVKFVIVNRTERASGSHFPGRFPPEYTEYLETLAAENPELRSEAAIPFIISNPVISVLAPKSRGETIDPEGGGTTWQTFTWTERYLGCNNLWHLPPPIVLPFLDIK